MKMRLAGVALVLVGCASGGKDLDPPGPGPDAATPPADSPAAEIPVDTAPANPADSQPADSSVTPPDTQQPPDACVAIASEQLANPALDLTPNGAGWTEVLIQNLEGGPYPIITADGAVAPISAPNKAWMGGATGLDAGAASVTDQLFQDITFPADATNFVITGMFVVNGVEVTTSVFDTFALDVTELNGTPIESVLVLNNMTPAAAFTPFSKTLTSNLAGRTVRLRATSTNDITDHTNFFLDSLSFKATFCP